MDSLCKAGFLAAELVCKDVHCKESNAAIVCFNSSSSLADDMIYQQTICDKNNYYPSPSVFVYTLANIVTGEIAIRHKITGESSFYIIENFSPIQIHNAITDIFDNDTVHYLLCGWTEYNDKHCDVLMMYIKRNGQPSANISPQSISDLYFFVK
jgi:hypothetical protein